MTKIPKLFEELEKQKITPAKLSADTGISPGNISDWKSGRSKPSAAKLAILSQYLNVSTDYLLGTETSEEPLDETDQQILMLARKSRVLPPEDKEMLMKVLKGSVDAFLDKEKK